MMRKHRIFRWSFFWLVAVVAAYLIARLVFSVLDALDTLARLR
jgi:hypothetical protein